MWQIIGQVISVVLFYGMFGFLLYVLWQLAQNIKTYAQAWQTLINVYKQNADSLQKVVDLLTAHSEKEKPPV